MKKILLTLIAALFMGATMNASVYDYHNHIDSIHTFNSLEKFLNLNSAQTSEVSYVQSVFDTEFQKALHIQNKDKRDNMIKSVIDYNVRNMGLLLTDKQYRKYMMVLNPTIKNRTSAYFASISSK